MTTAQQMPTHDDFRCSCGQQSLWLIDQIAPGNAAYNLHAAVRMPFTLMPEALAAAAAALVDRHETLRTVFDWDGYEPVQQILSKGPPCLQMVDLSAMSTRDANTELARLSREMAALPFDLEQAPLVRLGLVQMRGAKSVLLVTIHHIVADAWSMNILLRDLMAFYVAEITDQPAKLPDLPVQYADFAAWQRDQLDGNRHADLVSGWQRYLDGTAELDLRTDYPRGPHAAQVGDHIRYKLPRKLSRDCLQACRDFAVTPYALLTGCFAEVLHRYGGGDDFMIGMPTAGRPRLDLENLIGFFVRTLVLRIDLTGQPSFRDLAQRIGTSVAEALALQDLPFEQIVELVDPDRDLTQNPLFQVTSQYLSNPLERADGASVDVVDLHRGFANFDLTLDFWEEDGVIAGRLEYASGLFKAATIERLIGHILQLLERGLADPDAPLAALEMLTEAEKADILGPWSLGAQDFPMDKGIPALFADVVAAQSSASALRDEAGDLSYAALDRAARGVAAALLDQGLAPGACVGIGLPRGRDQVIAALGILMAGGAYVALDPAWPADRFAKTADVADIGHVIANGGPWADLGLTVIASGARGKSPVPDGASGPDSLAYVAFTSGSTGVPKGVPTTQRAVVRLMRAGVPFAFAHKEVMLGFAPLGFDASAFEIWGPLLGGACLAIAPDGPLSPGELAAFMADTGVTKAWLTAGYFSQMAQAEANALARLDAVFAGGDALPAPAVQSVLDRGGTVINGYGPTENTVFTCYAIMSELDGIANGIPIGRPVPGTWVYVLDHMDRPVPIGVPGELIAGGFGVSPGYLGDHPENLRFAPDPLYSDRGRVYRTGDLVRWREDGSLAFLGRRDRQVKIRGFRIELGEVEVAVQAHPTVRAACVAVRGTDADDKALVAFVVWDGAADAPGLRRHLANALPVQARPSAIVSVVEMPLGPTGKVDFAALLSLDIALDDAPPDDALTEIEDIVADTFADVLGRPSVPMDTPFFDLGGHSLHATRVVTRLREQLDVNLPLQAIFEASSVRGLAARLEDILLAEFDGAEAM